MRGNETVPSTARCAGGLTERAVPADDAGGVVARLGPEIRDPGRLLALIVLVFLLRGAFAIAVVPPWQHPDEPQHLALVHILARQTRFDLSDRRDVDVERRIIESMRDHQWWRHYEELAPDPLPASFSEISEHIAAMATAPPVYYVLGAGLLRLAEIEEPVAQSYALRWMALGLAVLTLLCVWAGSRRLFGTWVAVGATLLLALHPQFVLFSTAVNPATLVNLCGSVFWWLGARLLTGGSTISSGIGLVVVTVIALFTKRAGAPLLVMLVAVPMVAWFLGRHRAWRVTWPAVAATVGCLGLAGLVAAFRFGDEFNRLGEHWAYALTWSWAERARDWLFFRRFTAKLLDSAWLVAGWLRYPAPSEWLMLLRLLTIAAMVGCLVGARRSDLAPWRAGLALGGALVMIQTAGVYVGIYMNGYGPQGHYLFPAVGPFMALFWVGIHSWWPRRYWPAVTVAVTAFLVAFDAVGWACVIIPAFLG